MTKKPDCFTTKEKPYQVFCCYSSCLSFSNLRWIQNDSENVGIIRFHMRQCLKSA